MPVSAYVPPKLPEKVTTISLPGPVENAVVGGSGRFLILDLRSLQKLAVFDVSECKIAGYVSLEGANDVFAANAEKLMVVDRQSRIAKRYSLPGLKQETAQPIPGEVPIVAVAMGAASPGPLFVACNDNLHHQIFALDPATFQLSEFEMMNGTGRNIVLNVLNETLRLNASGDGSVLGGWNDRMQPSGVLIASTTANRMECFYQRTSSGYVCPDDLGERIYTGNGLLNSHGERLDDADPASQAGVLAVPAVGGPFYLTVPSDERTGVAPRVTNRTKTQPAASSAQGGNQVISVHVVGESAPLATLPLAEFRLPKVLRQLSDRTPALCRRLFLIPAAHVIAEIPEPRNALVLHQLDLDAQWNRVAMGPVILSRPPKSIHVGETLHYQIQARSKSGKPVFKLETAPDGMVLSASGLLEWTPAAQPPAGTVSAVVSISDSGQSKFHTIVLTVQPPEEVLIPADQGPPAAAVSADKPAGDVRLKLPAAYDDVCAGGSGQFLVFSLDSLQKLAVLDLFAAKIIGYVPVEGKCLFAAGAEKLVVVNPGKSVIERFDLQTQKLEASQPLPAGSPGMVAMGAASHGPVLVGLGGPSGVPRPNSPQAMLVNLDSLKPIDCKMPQQYRVQLGAGSRIRASADGRMFGSWATNVSPAGMQLLIFDGQELALFYQHTTPGWVVPDETGGRVYTTHGVFENQLTTQPPSNFDINAGAPIPAVQGPFCVRISKAQPGSMNGQQSTASAGVCLAEDTQPLTTLRDLPIRSSNNNDSFARDRVTLDKRVYLVPSGKLIAILPERQDSVVIRHFDPEEELQQSGKDYVVVMSRPPYSVSLGQTLEYQVVVKAKSDKLEYRVGGPDGMTISPSGLVRWEVKTVPTMGIVPIDISVVCGTQTARQDFNLTVQSSGETPPPVAAVQPTPPSAVVQTPGTVQRGGFTRRPATGSPAAPVTPIPSGPWQLTKVDDHRLKMSEGEAVLTPGLRYQSMLFLQRNHLAVLAPDGITISKIHELGTVYKRIAERADYYVAIAENPPAIDLLNKKTLATIRRIACDRGRPFDLAIYPTQAISYVSVIAAGQQDRPSFVIVDEKSGTIRDSKNYLGQWLVVDAAGQRLLAAGTFSRVVGSELIVVPRNTPGNPAVPQPGPRTGIRPNPAQPPRRGSSASSDVRVVTRRESIDALFVYDLQDDGTPRPEDFAVRSSSPDSGLRMAPDGMRATLIRAAGDNREAADLDDLDAKPVAYSGGTGPVLDLAYHPVLPLAACVGQNFSFVCDRETGKLQPDALKTQAGELLNARYHHVWFAADGKGLLFDMTAASGEHFLYRAKLNLSTGELEKVRRRLANMAALGRDLLADHALPPGKGSVPLAHIDAFQGGHGKEMSALEIGRAYMDAVVVVQDEEGFGTGFVVGKTGYIMTCALCAGGKERGRKSRDGKNRAGKDRAKDGGPKIHRFLPHGQRRKEIDEDPAGQGPLRRHA